MGRRGKAVIIGGGIAGKLAARVLSESFKEVIILEKDDGTAGPQSRKGARQGDHLHALLHAGHEGLETLFPGITRTFQDNGALTINSTQDLAWFHHGVWKRRHPSRKSTTLQSRPLLEWAIEQYIREIPNVTTLWNHPVKGLLYDSETDRIYGTEVRTPTGTVHQITADVVIDASGASSITTALFKQLHLTIPTETADIGLCYVSQKFRLPADNKRDWSIKLIYPNPPHEKIGGTISKIEDGQHMVTMIGYQDSIQEKEVVKSDAEFLQLAKRLPKPDIHDELLRSEPLSKTSVYRVPRISWKRIDRVKRLPKGLLLIGDTVCRIDPVFGQGMSIAVLEAMALQRLLRTERLTLDQIQSKFHKETAKIVSPIWNMVLTEDLRYPGVTGKKPIGLAPQQWFTKKVFLLSAENDKIYDAFVDVMNLVKPPTSLIRFRTLWHVARHSFFRKPPTG